VTNAHKPRTCTELLGDALEHQEHLEDEVFGLNAPLELEAEIGKWPESYFHLWKAQQRLHEFRDRAGEEIFTAPSGTETN